MELPVEGFRPLELQVGEGAGGGGGGNWGLTGFRVGAQVSKRPCRETNAPKPLTAAWILRLGSRHETCVESICACYYYLTASCGLRNTIGVETAVTANVGTFIIRIGFGGILYYNYNKEPPQTLF